MPLAPGRPVAVYTASPFFAFHHINAWHRARDSAVVFDVLANPNLTAANANPAAAFALDVVRDPSRRDVLGGGHLGELTRYTLHPLPPPAPIDTDYPTASTLPPAVGAVTVQTMDLVDADGRVSPGAELPTFNRGLSGRPHRYAYLWVPQARGSPRWSTMALLKKDVTNSSAPVLVWQRDGHFPGEPTFVSRPGAVREDDGVLLAAGTTARPRSQLAVAAAAAAAQQAATSSF